MTDALSAIDRDTDRAEETRLLLNKLADIVDARYNTEQRLALISDAKTIAGVLDTIRGGFFGGPTRLQEKIPSIVADLLDGDRETWTRVSHESYERLLVLSPFNGKVMIHADYGHGFVRLRGQVELVLAAVMRQRGEKPYAGKDAVFFVDQAPLVAAEVIFPDIPPSAAKAA